MDAVEVVPGKIWLKSESDVCADRITVEVVTPHVRSADADPLNFPEFAEKVENNAIVDFVHVVDVQAILDAAVKFSAAEITARAQFMAEEFFAERDININLVLPRLGVAVDRGMIVGAAKIFRVEIGAIGAERDADASEVLNPLEVACGTDSPGIHVPVNEAGLFCVRNQRLTG